MTDEPFDEPTELVGTEVIDPPVPCEPARKMIERAYRLHSRAKRKPRDSNGRLKDEEQARNLIRDAADLALVHGCPKDHTMSWIRTRFADPQTDKSANT